MAKKQVTPLPPKKMMLRRNRDGIVQYWSRLGWSEIFAMALDEPEAVTHAERMGPGIDVVPFAKIPTKPVSAMGHPYSR